MYAPRFMDFTSHTVHASFTNLTVPVQVVFDMTVITPRPPRIPYSNADRDNGT